MDYFPWLRFVGHPLYKRLLETCRLRDQLWGMLWSEIQDRYASAKGSGGDEEGNEFNDLLTISAQMLDNQSSQYQPLVDEENIKGMFINVLGGSISTTTASAYSLLNILLHHPKVYQRLQQVLELYTDASESRLLNYYYKNTHSILAKVMGREKG